MKLSISLYVLLVALISFHSLAPMYPRPHYSRPHHYYHNDIDGATVGRTALVIGGLLAVGYGLYKFCDWLFTPSNETLIKNAQNALKGAHHHDDFIIFIEQSLGGIPDSHREQKRLIESVNEPILYQIAIKKEHDSYMGSRMFESIRHLNAAHKDLTTRIDKLRTVEHEQRIILYMQEIDQEIMGTLLKLEFARDYFVHHASYYNLFEDESRLWKNYEFELQALAHHAHNQPYVRDALRASVMQSASYNRNSYPFMTYIEAAQSNINSLMSAMNGCAYNYAYRLNAAGELLRSIQIIHAIMIVEDAYHQELRDYKKEQLERQRIEAERAKAAAAAAQAAALQQQAFHMQRQNQLHAQQIRVDAERNAIMAAQTMVHAFNPPQTNVHVYT